MILRYSLLLALNVFITEACSIGDDDCDIRAKIKPVKVPVEASVDARDMQEFNEDININVSVIGNPMKIWSAVDTLHKCHIIDVPDIPVRAFVDNQNITHLICGSTSFHRMNGPSIFNVTRECDISWNETGNPNPAMFAANEFLDSTIAFPNGTVISLVHTEFPGNRYNQCNATNNEGQQHIPSYPTCWTVTIGLAISHDWGNTWDHSQPPPHHLVAAVPYKYNQTRLAYGWGDPSNIVKHPQDGYYYVAMWNRNQVELQEPGICIARTNNLMNASSWRAWNGSHFSVTFASPYDDIEAGQHICTVVNLPAPNCAALGLVWSVYLNKFVVTLGCFGSMGKSFYFATSDDLIHWSPDQEFYSQADLPPDVRANVTSFNYPAFLDPTSPSLEDDPNFYTIGRTPYLTWTSIGHSPHTDGRSLWATPMKFSKN